MKSQGSQDVYKFLIVDDEEHILKGFLKLYGNKFQIVTTLSGEEALNILEQDPSIGVVISDQRMDGMTGVEFLEKVKDKYPKKTRVLITGYTDLQVAVTAINRGQVAYYIQKPIEEKKVFETMCDALALHVEKLSVQACISEIHTRMQKRFEETFNSLVNGITLHANNCMTPTVAFFGLLPTKLKNFKNGKYDSNFFENFAEQSQTDLKRLIEILKMFSWVMSCKVSLLLPIEMDNLFVPLGFGLREALEKNSVEIEKCVKKSLPPVVVDPMKMRELFELLLKTCVLAAPPRSKVQVVAEEKVVINKEWYVRVQFSHEGKGYSQEECQRLFDPFFLFRETLHRASDGLDLTNCYFIAAKHGCELRAESQNGKGVIFTLDLPTVAPKTLSSSNDVV